MLGQSGNIVFSSTAIKNQVPQQVLFSSQAKGGTVSATTSQAGEDKDTYGQSTLFFCFMQQDTLYWGISRSDCRQIVRAVAKEWYLRVRAKAARF